MFFLVEKGQVDSKSKSIKIKVQITYMSLKF